MNPGYLVGIITLILLDIVSPQAEPVESKPVDTTAQVDFSWQAYKKAIFVSTIGEVTTSNRSSDLQSELKAVLKLKADSEPTAQSHRSYVAQWLRLSKATDINMTTMVIAIGQQQVAKAFDSIIDNCVIYTGHLQRSTPEKMSMVINDALENITNGSEKEFLTKTDINQNWKFLAVDSWQYGGLWKYSFQKEFTATCYFHENKGKKGLTHFMYLEAILRYGNFPKWNVQAVELPYHDQSPLSCVLLKPLVTNLDALINSFNQTQFKKIYTSMTAARTTVRLPQFGLRTTLPGRQLLEDMGLKVPFNQGVFQVFERHPNVMLGEIVQKVSLEMGYEGQQTAQRFVDKQSDKQFTAHQPFVFVIFDRKDLVPVMMGHYLKVPDDSTSENEDMQLCEDAPKPTSFN